MNLKLTKYNVERLESQESITLADVMSFFHDLDKDLENQDLFLDELEIGDADRVARWLPWLSLFVSDTYDAVKSDMSPGVGKNKLENMQGRLREIHDEMEKYTKELEGMDSQIRALEEEEDKLQDRKQEFEQKRSRLEDLKKRTQEAALSKEAYESSIAQAGAELEQVEEECRRLSDVLDERTDVCAEAKSKLAAVQAEIRKNGEDYEMVCDNLEAEKRKHRELEEQIRNDKRECDEIRANYLKLCDDREKYQQDKQALEKKIDDLKKRMNDGELEGLQKELVRTEESLEMRLQAAAEAKESMRMAEREVEEQKKILDSMMLLKREKRQEKQKYVNLQSHMMTDWAPLD